ncbi:hypothetical protein EZV62_014925 [Acer yangbiense]|uniref:O-fucosyltransferase family protein n=1 Tax=Acer yangbiense TaxID=1000413 RepID=A0A5C7HVX6_9ROSI|nr:hypothetical protein EZV62_014925 [Acer yangbiense]
MVNHRGGSYHTRGFSRRPSFFTIITLCIILLSSCSIFFFLVSTRNVSDDDDDHQKDRLVEHFNSHSQSQSQSNFQSESQSLPEHYHLQNLVKRNNNAVSFKGNMLLCFQFCRCQMNNCGMLRLAMVYIPASNPLLNTKFSNAIVSAQGSDRYITVRSNGGLNQMRTGISDMVAVAHIMNATLVIPQLDKRSFWQDSSTFSDIFDELHFITSLQGDLRIVGELPKELESVPRARKHFTSWSGMGYYEEMTESLKDYQVIHVAKSDSRLANNGLPLDIQRLRCRTLYHALRFSPSIENLGKV